MDMGSILPGSAAGGLIIAAAYAFKQLSDWLKERRAAPLTATSTTVHDATTANAALVQTVESLTAENARLRDRVQHLEDVDRAKTKTIERLQTDVQRINDELIRLKAQP